MHESRAAKAQHGAPCQIAARVARILVVDDEDAVRRLLRNLFELEGYAVSEARTGAEALRCLTSENIAVARQMRAVCGVPIIMVTAKSGDVDRIVGLELGADDYIVKPFNVREVLARVRAVLRRTEPKELRDATERRSGFQFDGFELDLNSRSFTSTDGTSKGLTTAEFRLLEAFLRRPSRVLSRNTLIDLVGGQDAEPLERSIDTLVGRLRKKIEANAGAPALIKTVRGVGYIFTAKVTAF